MFFHVFCSFGLVITVLEFSNSIGLLLNLVLVFFLKKFRAETVMHQSPFFCAVKHQSPMLCCVNFLTIF